MIRQLRPNPYRVYGGREQRTLSAEWSLQQSVASALRFFSLSDLELSCEISRFLTDKITPPATILVQHDVCFTVDASPRVQPLELRSTNLYVFSYGGHSDHPNFGFSVRDGEVHCLPDSKPKFTVASWQDIRQAINQVGGLGVMCR